MELFTVGLAFVFIVYDIIVHYVTKRVGHSVTYMTSVFKT